MSLASPTTHAYSGDLHGKSPPTFDLNLGLGDFLCHCQTGVLYLIVLFEHNHILLNEGLACLMKVRPC
ncbi:hypothetical protein RJT34_12466 [Clitoria ternatea]|uniref:Uncharacterized protein n=1 Tax=Clitoria ternatea TaxID=43366 RepID=A0AAN9JQD7_CLITE